MFSNLVSQLADFLRPLLPYSGFVLTNSRDLRLCSANLFCSRSLHPVGDEEEGPLVLLVLIVWRTIWMACGLLLTLAVASAWRLLSSTIATASSLLVRWYTSDGMD